MAAELWRAGSSISGRAAEAGANAEEPFQAGCFASSSRAPSSSPAAPGSWVGGSWVGGRSQLPRRRRSSPRGDLQLGHHYLLEGAEDVINSISPHGSISLQGAERRGLRAAAELVSMKTELNDIMASLVHCRPDSLYRSEMGAVAAGGICLAPLHARQERDSSLADVAAASRCFFCSSLDEYSKT